MPSIYGVGRLGDAQAARRDVDGLWFRRERSPLTGHWGAWRQCGNDRPDGAWFDAEAGPARVPRPVTTALGWRSYADG